MSFWRVWRLNWIRFRRKREDAEQKMFILAEKVDQYRDDEETLKTALLNAQRMGKA